VAISLTLALAIAYYGVAITHNLKKSKAVGQTKAKTRIDKV